VVLCDELVKYDRWWPTTIRHVEGNFFFIFYVKKLEKINKKKKNLSNLHLFFVFPKIFPISLLKNSKILLGKQTLVGGHHFWNLTNYNITLLILDPSTSSLFHAFHYSLKCWIFSFPNLFFPNLFWGGVSCDLCMKEGSLFCFVCTYEIKRTGMLQIVFLVSSESSQRGGVHGLGSMMFGLAVQKVLEYRMISSLKIKLN